MEGTQRNSCRGLGVSRPGEGKRFAKKRQWEGKEKRPVRSRRRIPVCLAKKREILSKKEEKREIGVRGRGSGPGKKASGPSRSKRGAPPKERRGRERLTASEGGNALFQEEFLCADKRRHEEKE